MNDSISSDPRLLAEARDMLSAKPAPAVMYDTRAVFFEVWNTIAEPSLPGTDAALAWTNMENTHSRESKQVVLYSLSEPDFRRMVRSMAMGTKAIGYSMLSKKIALQAQVLKSTVTIESSQAAGIKHEDNNMSYDLINGCVRGMNDTDAEQALVALLKALG